MAELRVSIVVPTLNEERTIATQLGALAALPGVHEVIVVDGSSEDATVALAARGGAQVLVAPRGRGAQMNAGARVATGDVLLFLHADVRLPHDAMAEVRRALQDPAVVGGAFCTWTQLGAGEGRALSWLVHLADLRSRYTQVPYGDQAIFVRAEVFRQLGGFACIPLMEDLDFSLRLRRCGKLARVGRRVLVSGRRFASRPFYYAALMNLLPLLYRAGVAPARLQRLYGDPR